MGSRRLDQVKHRQTIRNRPTPAHKLHTFSYAPEHSFSDHRIWTFRMNKKFAVFGKGTLIIYGWRPRDNKYAFMVATPKGGFKYSTPVLLDIGNPLRTMEEQMQDRRTIGEIIKELSKVGVYIPYNYREGPIEFRGNLWQN